MDLGFGKKGGNGKIPQFNACGLLTSGNSAEFRLFDVPPQSLSILVISNQSNPTKIAGGTLVPVPLQFLIHFVADKNGKVNFTIPGGGGPLSMFGQYAVFDPKASHGISFSNALRIDFQR